MAVASAGIVGIVCRPKCSDSTDCCVECTSPIFRVLRTWLALQMSNEEFCKKTGLCKPTALGESRHKIALASLSKLRQQERDTLQFLQGATYKDIAATVQQAETVLGELAVALKRHCQSIGDKIKHRAANVDDLVVDRLLTFLKWHKANAEAELSKIISSLAWARHVKNGLNPGVRDVLKAISHDIATFTAEKKHLEEGSTLGKTPEQLQSIAALYSAAQLTKELEARRAAKEAAAAAAPKTPQQPKAKATIRPAPKPVAKKRTEAPAQEAAEEDVAGPSNKKAKPTTNDATVISDSDAEDGEVDVDGDAEDRLVAAFEKEFCNC